jgi:hypothetical protein
MPAALSRDPSRVKVKVLISRFADYHIHISPYFMAACQNGAYGNKGNLEAKWKP